MTEKIHRGDIRRRRVRFSGVQTTTQVLVSLYVTNAHIVVPYQSQVPTPATPATPATPVTPQAMSASRPLSPQQAGMRPIADYDYDDDADEFDTDDDEFDEIEWQAQNAGHFTVLDSSLPTAQDGT